MTTCINIRFLSVVLFSCLLDVAVNSDGMAGTRPVYERHIEMRPSNINGWVVCWVVCYSVQIGTTILQRLIYSVPNWIHQLLYFNLHISFGCGNTVR